MKENNTKELLQNPELPIEHQADAFKITGNSWDQETTLKVNEQGSPIELIDKEASANDHAGYWRIHERKVWSVLGMCILYLSLKIFGA